MLLSKEESVRLVNSLSVKIVLFEYLFKSGVFGSVTDIIGSEFIATDVKNESYRAHSVVSVLHSVISVAELGNI